MNKKAAQRSVHKTVNPFEFWPTAQSRVAGLGGNAPAPDPAYAFHAPYVEIGQGVVTCTLRFERLEATIGLLNVQVNGLAPDPGAKPELIRTWTADLRDVAESDGVLELSFQASAGSFYAVMGHIYQECDARARSMAVELSLAPDAGMAEGQQAVRKSLFGRRVFRRTAKLEVRGQPSLADPVSQPCTLAQLAEPSFAEWSRALSHDGADDAARWPMVYVLQSLERYNVLRPGAQGIGFGVEPSPLPAVMAARGCSVLSTRHVPNDLPVRQKAGALAGALERLRYPTLCADDVFDRQVNVGAMDMNAIDLGVTGFDFAWSVHAIERLGSIDAAAVFVRDSVNALAFGGMAVHVTLLNTRSLIDTVGSGAISLLRRQDLERIAVDLVSRGHYVAQLNFALGTPPLDPIAGERLSPDDADLATALDGYAPMPFGLIVRRGDR